MKKVKFCRINSRGHACRHEQKVFLSQLLNQEAIKKTVNFCIDQYPASTQVDIKDFILGRVELLLDEMVR